MGEPGPASIAAWRCAGYGLSARSMKILLRACLQALALLTPHPLMRSSAAARRRPRASAASVVTIVGSRGNFCTGALIAPKLVLTAAHCVPPGADYKIVEYGADQQPQLQDVRTVAMHPGFNMQAMLAHRATADVALLQLDAPPRAKLPAALGVPQHSDPRRQPLHHRRHRRHRARRRQERRHHPRRRPGRDRQARHAADPPGRSGRAGHARRARRLHRRFRRARCSRTSQGGPVIVGVVSWSTGPNGTAGCGGLTGVTPLTLYRDWILQTARQWGSAL